MFKDRTNISDELKSSNAVVLKAHKFFATESAESIPEYDPETESELFLLEYRLYQNRTYLQVQPEMSEKMRCILVDWLLDVTSEFKLHIETFFLTVDIVDRFLLCYAITRNRLQLVGICAMLIASKHEEIIPLSIHDCVKVTANTYSKLDVIDMERAIACALRFKFTIPTTFVMATRLLHRLEPLSNIILHALNYFLESSAHCYDMLNYLPSQIAGACIVGAEILIAYNYHSASYRSPNAEEENAQFMCWRNNFDKRVDHLQSISANLRHEVLCKIIVELYAFTTKLVSTNSSLDVLRRKYLASEVKAVAMLKVPPPEFVQLMLKETS